MAKRKKQQLTQSLRQFASKEQEEIFDAHTGRRETIKVKDIRGVLEFSEDECREVASWRVKLNLRETKHPFHHKTASGVIVTQDPTLEYLLSRLPEAEQQQFREIYSPTPEQEAQALEAFPVNRKYYGFDPFEGH